MPWIRMCADEVCFEGLATSKNVQNLIIDPNCNLPWL